MVVGVVVVVVQVGATVVGAAVVVVVGVVAGLMRVRILPYRIHIGRDLPLRVSGVVGVATGDGSRGGTYHWLLGGGLSLAMVAERWGASIWTHQSW